MPFPASSSSKPRAVLICVLFFVFLLCAQVRLVVAGGYGDIVSLLHRGKCVDVKGLSQNSNEIIHQRECTGQENQKWQFEPWGGETNPQYYQVRVLHSGQCMSIKYGSADDGAAVVQQPCKGQDSQLWRVQHDVGRHQQIIVKHTNMCLTIHGGGVDNGTKLTQLSCTNTTTSELWKVETRALAASPSPPSLWEGPYQTPIINAAATVLPDGRILGWVSYAKFTFGGDGGKTNTAIFDPSTKQSVEKLVNTTGHDMFCPGTAVLEDGRLFITGGSSTTRTTMYDVRANSWTRGPSLNKGRGYHSMTVLPDGSVFTLGGIWSGGGGNKYGELWNADTEQWEAKMGIPSTGSLATVSRNPDHMWLFTAPNGRIFHAGPAIQTHWIDVGGKGSYTPTSVRRGDTDALNGNVVMYDIGKLLTLGGAPQYSGGSMGLRSAFTMDLNNGDNVVIKRVGDMNAPRVYVNSAVLPSGEVVVVGGQRRAWMFTDRESVLFAEIYNPDTESFSPMSRMKVPRNYHSVAILMKDGRVWSAGGGVCGIGCPSNHADVEILTPPYLLNEDGTVVTSRPAILSATSATFPGGRVAVTMDSVATFKFAMIRTGAVTHSINNDNRRIPLSVVSSDNGSFTLAIPSNAAVSLPGTYFLFALNEAGVPSVATSLHVSSSIPSTNPAPAPSPTKGSHLVGTAPPRAANCQLAVTGFTLMDATKDKPLRKLPALIQYNRLYEQYLNVRASYTNCPGQFSTRSVKFTFDGKTFCDRRAPFSLFGDRSGDYNGRVIPLGGPYELSATPYASNDCSGEPGKSRSRRVSVVTTERYQGCPGAPAYFELYNTDTNTLMGPIKNRMKICLPRRQSVKLNIKAVMINCGEPTPASGRRIGSVEFNLSGALRRKTIGNGRDFYLFRGTKNAEAGQQMKAGKYLLTARAYRGQNGSGLAGGSATAVFEFVDPQLHPSCVYPGTL